MPYVIMFVDDPGVLEKKKELRPVHLEYVIKNAHRIIASGGLFPVIGQFARRVGLREVGRGSLLDDVG
jgi:uncharacterized protein YciI